jgi:hypothetical protein
VSRALHKSRLSGRRYKATVRLRWPNRRVIFVTLPCKIVLVYNKLTLTLMKPCVNTKDHRRIAYSDSIMKGSVREEADKLGLFQSRHEVTLR